MSWHGVSLFVSIVALTLASGCASFDRGGSSGEPGATEIGTFVAYRRALEREDLETAVSYLSPRVLRRVVARAASSREPEDAKVAVALVQALVTGGDVVAAVCSHRVHRGAERTRLALVAEMPGGTQRNVTVWFVYMTGTPLIDGWEYGEIVADSQRAPCNEGVQRFATPSGNLAPIA